MSILNKEARAHTHIYICISWTFYRYINSCLPSLSIHKSQKRTYMDNPVHKYLPRAFSSYSSTFWFSLLGPWYSWSNHWFLGQRSHFGFGSHVTWWGPGLSAPPSHMCVMCTQGVPKKMMLFCSWAVEVLVNGLPLSTTVPPPCNLCWLHFHFQLRDCSNETVCVGLELFML